MSDSELERPATSPASHGSAAICKHILAYADEQDAVPCPVCESKRLRQEVERLYEAMRHGDFWNSGHETGFGTTTSTCRGCGCHWWPKIPELGGPTKHKENCPFRFWLDAEGRVTMPPNDEFRRTDPPLKP